MLSDRKEKIDTRNTHDDTQHTFVFFCCWWFLFPVNSKGISKRIKWNEFRHRNKMTFRNIKRSSTRGGGQKNIFCLWSFRVARDTGWKMQTFAKLKIGEKWYKERKTGNNYFFRKSFAVIFFPRFLFLYNKWKRKILQAKNNFQKYTHTHIHAIP